MRRALIIANEVYHDQRFATLPGAVADANSLEEVLRDPAIGAFDVTVLRDADVYDIGVAIANHFNSGHPDDVLLLHISAHGLKDAHGNLFFAASNSSYDTYLLNATALSAADIRQEMADSRARRIIVLLDCCYSGAFVPGERSRGRDSADLTEPFRGRGHVVITASTAAQHSYEVGGQGVFTRAVVEALRTGRADRNRDGIIDTDELYHYVSGAVRREMPRQSPTLSAHNVEGVLQVARSPRPDSAGPDTPPVPIQGDRPRPSLLGRLRHAAGAVGARTRRQYRRALAARPVSLPRRAAIAILTTWAVLLGLGAHADAAGTWFPGCVHPPEIRVATSAAGYLAYREVADAYEQWTAGRNGGCSAARLYLYPASADQVREGIRAGWPSSGVPSQRYLREVGPHPDLWLPESHSDLDRLTAQGAAPPIRRVDRIASTPLVLGVPADRVHAGQDAGQRTMTLSWHELFAKATAATAADWGVVRADPTTSTVARLASVALYRTDETDLLPAYEAREQIERPLDEALDTGAFPIGDDAALLCRYRILGATPQQVQPPAVVLTEQALIRLNQGRPLGGNCGTNQPPSTGNRLQAFYPDDSPVVVQPVVQLRWRDQVQGLAVRTAATDFARWLTTEADGKRALLQVGLRPYGYDVGAPIDTSNGVLREWPFGLPRQISEPPVAEQDRALVRYAEANRPGRVLVALDASGSMRSSTQDQRRSRFEVALAGVGQSLDRMGARDEFGLLTFSTAAANSRLLVPIGRPTAAQARAVRAAAEQIRPAGDTPLYRAVLHGRDLLRGGDDETLRALVVLTDGRDTSTQAVPTAAQLRGVRVYFLAVGDVSCAGSVLDRLADGTGGGCFDTGPDTIDTVLGRLFEGLWKGTA
ncbi:caspase, EACC1-associated type [Plantactinospora soyae]|uniref:VWFA domain-containing protein n=1 Tax=Plantactinospora soyae TaxID=1544732 RepID=A0A927R1N2_9ACTN|nr:caspase family protein [Plantactinospora soyae]MBE1491582.1 hypothetical protein [Plantactinospora soyae]